MRGITYDRVFVASDIGQELLATAYLLLQRDKLLTTLLYDRVPTLREFLAWEDLPDARYLGAFVSNAGHAELAGIGWLWNIKGPPGGRRADVGIVFFRKFWRGGIPESLTREMVEWSFTTAQVDVLYGITPAWNRAAQEMARRIGFTLTGVLPKWGSCRGKVGDAVMTHLTKEAWELSRGEAV